MLSQPFAPQRFFERRVRAPIGGAAVAVLAMATWGALVIACAGWVQEILSFVRVG
jgi:hypothetical protein